jgi:hypothetical protein
MEGVLREDRRKSLRVLNWAIRLTQTIRSQPRGRLFVRPCEICNPELAAQR